MKIYELKYHLSTALTNARQGVRSVIAWGPSKCARLALAVAFGLLAVVALVALALAALVLLVPVAVVVIVLGGLALMLWPFSLPTPKA